MKFTWFKSPKDGKGLRGKLDRIMANMRFIDSFTDAFAIFKPYRISDHCPAILSLPLIRKRIVPPFKFVNDVADKEEFIPMVKHVSGNKVEGYFMYQVTQKLKLLKRPCRKLFNNSCNFEAKKKELRNNMDHNQILLDSNPDNEAVRGDLANVMNEYYSLCVDEEKFLKQRSKVKWLSEGDKNMTFFHNTLRSNMNWHRIEAVLDEGGSWVRGKYMTDRFVGAF